MKRYIHTAIDVFKYVAFLRYQKQEQVRVLYLTYDNELICSRGLESESMYSVSFTVKDIFRTAIIAGASALIVVHNHPSGSLEPSKEDMVVTKKIIRIGKLLGIEVVDHLVVTKTAFKSIIKG